MSFPVKQKKEGRQMKKSKHGNQNKGCLQIVGIIVVIAVLIAIYSYAWIPAIGFLIYFCVRPDVDGTKKKKITISIAIIITSILTNVFLNTTPDLEDISVTWDKTTYDINDTVTLDITQTPSSAEITSVNISDNDIADMTYENGKITITFNELGTADIYFTANDTIVSKTTTITVIDEEAEEQKRLEEEAAAQKAEEERLAAEEAARQQAEEEARKQAELEAQQQAEAEAQQAAAQQQAQQQQETMVWIPSSGSKYHSHSGCSNMNNPTQVTKSEAESRGFAPCKRCY